MSAYEPSSAEVSFTLLLGTLASSFYKRYVDRLPLKGSEHVLDFGSGSGVCSRHLAQRLLNGGGRLTCVDVSHTWQRVVRNTLKRYPNVDYACGDIATLDIPDASYDAVFIHFVLHDIPAHELPDIVRHLARTLKAGSLLFIREPVERGGIPTDGIRRLMNDSGLHETGFQMTNHWFTGPVYEGMFCKLKGGCVYESSCYTTHEPARALLDGTARRRARPRAAVRVPFRAALHQGGAG